MCLESWTNGLRAALMLVCVVYVYRVFSKLRDPFSHRWFILIQSGLMLWAAIGVVRAFQCDQESMESLRIWEREILPSIGLLFFLGGLMLLVNRLRRLLKKTPAQAGELMRLFEESVIGRRDAGK